MVNRFVLNEDVLSWRRAIANIAVEAKNRAFKKALYAPTQTSSSSALPRRYSTYWIKTVIAYEVYDNYQAESHDENVQSGVAAFKKSGADYLIAIGGGSSMDTAKAIGIIINNPEFADVRILEA